MKRGFGRRRCLPRPWLWVGLAALCAGCSGLGRGGDAAAGIEASEPEPEAPHPVHRVALIPAHGGKRAEASATDGDKWDPVKQVFLERMGDGAHHRELDYFEARWSMDVTRRLRELLELTASREGWAEFARLLARYAVAPEGGFKRVGFEIMMTHEQTFLDRPATPNINKYYRFYDSPESFDSRGRPSKSLYPGMLTRLNRFAPELAVTIHINNLAVPDPSVRGMGSVITPDYEFFSAVRAAYEAGAPDGLEEIAPELYGRGRWANPRLRINDACTYFSGFRLSGGYFGVRSEMFEWAYNEAGFPSEEALRPPEENLIPLTPTPAFWERERSAAESRRRGGGPEGEGGDNFYASEELLRFIRSALALEAGSSPGLDAEGVDELLGPHRAPYVSDFAVPMLTNAVTAYIETGYLFQDRDRELLDRNRQLIAEAAAVAVYSLFTGVEPLETGRFPGGPRGAAVDFEYYRRAGHFGAARP